MNHRKTGLFLTFFDDKRCLHGCRAEGSKP